MSEQIEVAQQAPRVLADGDVYAVKVGPHYFGKLDEDGYPVLFRYPRGESLEAAKACVEQLKTNDHVYGKLTIVKLQKDRADDITFWVDDNGDGHFTSRGIQIADVVRHWLEDMPDWFKAAMMAADPTNDGWDDHEREDYNVAWGVFYDKTNETPDKFLGKFLDHFGWSGGGEDSYFVSEPYELGAEGIQNLAAVCSHFGFDYHISGRSIHYPSSTIRIEIRPLVKLPYTERVRVVSAEQLKQEALRDGAELRLTLTLAADFIEHVIHLVGEEYKSEFAKDLSTIRGFGNDSQVSASLDRFAERMNFKCRELHREGRASSAEAQIAYAMASLGERDKHGIPYLPSVAVHCADAVDNAAYADNDSWTMESYGKARSEETNWQEERRKSAEEAFLKEWVR